MTNTDTATARPTITRWDRRRDKYGRTTHVAITAEGGEYGAQSLVGAVVTMPKVYRDSRPGEGYLVNLWGKGAPWGEVSYHATLKAAKAHFAAHALTGAEYRA
jgi:hypothetical protein